MLPVFQAYLSDHVPLVRLARKGNKLKETPALLLSFLSIWLQPPSSQLSHLPELSLILSSLFKAGKACLNKLKGERVEPNKNDDKKVWFSFETTIPFSGRLEPLHAPQRNDGQLTAVSPCMAWHARTFLLPPFSSVKETEA
jgi:hypothetical protein